MWSFIIGYVLISIELISELILFYSISTVTSLLEALIPCHLVYFTSFLTSILTFSLLQTFLGMVAKFIFLMWTSGSLPYLNQKPSNCSKKWTKPINLEFKALQYVLSDHLRLLYNYQKPNLTFHILYASVPKLLLLWSFILSRSAFSIIPFLILHGWITFDLQHFNPHSICFTTFMNHNISSLLLLLMIGIID